MRIARSSAPATVVDQDREEPALQPRVITIGSELLDRLEKSRPSEGLREAMDSFRHDLEQGRVYIEDCAITIE